ncbi:hypothetical protein JCM3774_006183 [Rhodotorula dairenensis]
MATTNPSLYSDALAGARNPAAAFEAVDLRVSVTRAVTADLAQLLAERAQLELAYAKSLAKLQHRLHAASGHKDSLTKELDALDLDSPAAADQLLGPAWTAVRKHFDDELADSARVHQTWADALLKDVHDPLRSSLARGEWARWNAAEAHLAHQAKEYHLAVEKSQRAQQKQTKSSKSSNQSKLLQAQAQLSSLGSQLAAALPAFLDQSQHLDLAHAAFLKEALVRCGTLTADLGRERMEAGERLTLRVLAVDEAAEAQQWALSESSRLGGAAAAASGHNATTTTTMPSIGEFGESAPASAQATTTTRAVRSESVADRSDAASTRSAATSSRGTNDRQQRAGARPGGPASQLAPPPPPAAPLPLPTTDDARSTKEKRGFGSRLSTLIGGGGGGGGGSGTKSFGRDRSSSIPNSARYADFSASSSSSPPPPVPTVVTPPSASPAFERRPSDSSDLFGGGGGGGGPPMAGGPASLVPEQPHQQQKRKSLMPGSGLFRRASSRVNDGSSSLSSGAAAGIAAGGGLTTEPEEEEVEEAADRHGAGERNRYRVDAEGYSVPPQGYDRGIQESATGAGAGAAARQRSLLDDDEEDEDGASLGQSRASSVPKLSIIPDVAKSGPATGAGGFLPRESEAERLAALESVKNVLGASGPAGSASGGGGASGAGGLALGAAAGVSRRATARGRRGTGPGSGTTSPQSSLPAVPALSPVPVRQDSDDVPLATVVQQKHRREAPPPPPSSSSMAANQHRDVSASPSLPTSPAGSSFNPAPGRTMSVLSATSSLGATSTSLNPRAATSRPDPFADATTPGLRASIVETVNVLLKGGEVTRLLVTGEVGLSYRPSPSSAAASAAGSPLKVRLTGLEALEKKAPNPALLLPGVEPGEFSLSAAATAAGGGPTTTVFKYQLSLPATTTVTPAPILVKPVWRCDPAHARAIVTYSVNGASPLFAPAAAATTSPFGGDGDGEAAMVVVDDLKLELTLANGTVTSFQAKPASAGTALSPSGKSLTFSSLPPLSLASGEQKILASLATDGGQAAPGPVNVSWTVHGRTLGQVGIEVVTASGAEEVVDLVEVRRETVSGRYVAA